MKKMVLVTIALASASAFAQTATSTATTTSTIAPTATSGTATPASPVTQVGTSTASAEQKPADDKRWSGSFSTVTYITHEQLQRVGEQTLDTINAVGAGYKITKDTKLGVRQYFGYKVGRDSDGQATAQWLAATVGTKVNGILGSDAIAPTFWYYVPTDYALKNIYTKERVIAHNGVLRMDAEIAWTLSPKVTVSYYLNPRQSLVSNGSQSYTDNSGKPASVESTTTLYHFAYAYYNVSDSIQPYVFGAEHNRYAHVTGNMPFNNVLAGVGVNISALGGKVTVNPEIYNDVQQGQQMFENSNMNASLTLAVSL